MTFSSMFFIPSHFTGLWKPKVPPSAHADNFTWTHTQYLWLTMHQFWLGSRINLVLILSLPDSLSDWSFPTRTLPYNEWRVDRSRLVYFSLGRKKGITYNLVPLQLVVLSWVDGSRWDLLLCHKRSGLSDPDSTSNEWLDLVPSGWPERFNSGLVIECYHSMTLIAWYFKGQHFGSLFFWKIYLGQKVFLERSNFSSSFL